MSRQREQETTPHADPRSSNTGVQSSQSSSGRVESPHHVSGDHDYFEFRAYGRANAGRWKELKTFLEGRRIEAEQAGKPVVVELPEGDVAAIRPQGYGKRDGRFPWVLEWRSGSIAISDQHERGDDAPAFHCDFRGLSCMAYGAQALLDDSQALMRSLGLEIEYTKRATRMDLCVDVTEMSIETFVEAYEARRFITKAKTHSAPVENDGKNNVRFGKKKKGSVQFEVYNKLLEVFMKQGPKVPYMLERWGGELPDCAIRAEVRIFGGYRINKEYGITTAQDSIDHSANLASYFCNDWLRFTNEVNERTDHHQGRLTTADHWETITTGMKEAFMQTDRSWAKRPKRLASDVDGLEKQGWGCLRAQFAYLYPNGTIKDWDRFMETKHREKRPENWEKIQELQKLHEATKAYGDVDDPNAGGIPF